jgi:hypothetical protein
VTNYSECHHKKVYAMKPGPKPSSGTAMTHAERQSRYRAKQAAGTPTFRYRKPIDRRSRVQRWCDAVAELQDLQDDYQAWLDACRKIWRTVPPPRPCARSAISICQISRVSFHPGGSAATKLLHHVKRNQVVAEWTIDGRILVIINRGIG